jgi:hypothetical protein
MVSSVLVETARCERCAVYTPREDLVFSRTGRIFCTTCGVPADADVIEWARPARTRIEHHARVVAAVMLLITLCFPLAACASQL